MYTSSTAPVPALIGATVPTYTGEGWVATAPLAVGSNFTSVTWGSTVTGTAVAFGLDPTNGGFLSGSYVPLGAGPSLGSGTADFVGNANLQGTGNGSGGLQNGEMMDVNSGGAFSVEPAPEPLSCVIWALIAGCVGLAVWRRRR